MSGSNLPYQLRPSKFIDRQMFVELLSRLIQVRGPEKYIYISMGGQHLVDHYAVYKELGIKAQFSFDEDENAVARQKFNRPTDATICETMHSSALAAELDAISNRFPKKSNFIVWLDYTDAKRKVQLQEAEQILIRLRHGDVFRITLNAEIRNMKDQNNRRIGNPTERADLLRSQLKELLPTSRTEIADTELPETLASCVEMVAQKAKSQVPTLEIKPVLVTSYADGQRMLTVTCAVSESTVAERFPSQAYKHWEFACRGWKDIHDISVPVLSAKERFKLDGNLKKTGKRMLAALKFWPAEDEGLSISALESYKKFHRFYPSFRHVDD